MTPTVSIEEQAEAFKALKRGEVSKVEFWDGSNWLQMVHRDYHTSHAIRLKPAPPPKYRAWKPEEVPLGVFVRNKLQGIESHISARDGNRIALSQFGWFDCDWLFTACEQLDGSPCGVLEPQQ